VFVSHALSVMACSVSYPAVAAVFYTSKLLVTYELLVQVYYQLTCNIVLYLCELSCF